MHFSPRRAFIALVSSVAIVATVFEGVSVASTVSWITPPSQSVVTSSPVMIRGFISAVPANGVKVTVKRPGDPAVVGEAVPTFTAGKLFTVAVELAPGRNNIILDDSVLNLYYQPDPTAKKPWKNSEGFAEPGIHKAADKCDQCHWVHDGELTLNADLPGLCVKCHKGLAPVGRNLPPKAGHHEKQLSSYCVACHDPHSSFNGKLLKARGNACTGCHKKFGEGSGHEKAGVQSCLPCHDAHRSENTAMLKGTGDAYCVECHREVKNPSGSIASSHLPVATKSCLTCHSHHKTSHPSLLLEDPEKLCIGCHANRVDLPGHRQKLKGCLGCHTGHSSSNTRLLRGESSLFCQKCHKEWYAKGNGHVVEKGAECFQCHTPHQKTETAKAFVLCGPCHSLSGEEFSFVHGGLNFESTRQCLTCHRMHAPETMERHKGLMYGAPHYPIRNGGCLVCHTVTNGKISMRYQGSENCVRCHGATVGTSIASEPEKIHAPIRQDDCIACHSPHFKSYPHMLLDEQDRVCEFCHGMVTRMGPERHKALDNKDGCIHCHVPHISDDRPLLRSSQPEVCLECHPGKMPPQNDKLAHGAMRAGRCGGCHDPHSSGEKKLIKLTSGEICVGCHPEALKDPKGKPFTKLHGPVGANQCTACHYLGHSHKEAGDKFLDEKPPWKVCKECHSDLTDAHVPSIYSFRLARNQEGCLGCHFPHGANNQFLLKE